MPIDKMEEQEEMREKERIVYGFIGSKINGNPKGVYVPISKVHSILVLANQLAQNNLWFCYCGQVNSLQLKSSVASKWERETPLGVPFILLFMVHGKTAENCSSYLE